jgi:hypothetical protein
MKFTSGLVLKIVLALAPAVAGSVVTYFLSKDKAAGGYTTLSGSVNELQGAVEQLRLQVEHIQDLHFTNQPASAPASAPANACVAAKPVVRPAPLNISDLLGDISASKGSYSMKPAKVIHSKQFKRVPLRLDDARK